MLMTYSHLFKIMEEASLSPEQMGQRLGISGMSLRRWKSMPGEKPLPPLYQNALEGVTHQLVAEGKLSILSSTVKAVLSHEWLPFQNAAANMGFSVKFLEKIKKNPDSAIETLTQIGGSEERKSIVDKNTKKIDSFKKMGEDWTSRIKNLTTVLRSPELRSIDKLVAYGALFYLINPFDFIPDYIPVFGLLDDFLILGIAVAYYLKQHPELFSKK